MKFKFTKTAIANLPLAEKGDRIFHWDSTTAGFGLYISSESKTWYIQGRLCGKLKNKTLGKVGVVSLDGARAAAKLYLESWALGNDLDQIKRTSAVPTFGEILEQYIGARDLAASSAASYRNWATCHLSDWLEVPITIIGRKMVLDRYLKIRNGYSTKEGKRGGKGAARAVYSVMTGVFNFALESYDDLLTRNPARVLAKTKVLTPLPPRKGYVKPEQLPLLFGLKDGSMKDYLLVLLFTGLRKTEVASLKGSNIHGDCIIIKTKTQARLEVPVSGFVQEIFARLTDGMEKGEYLFHSHAKCGHITDPRKALWETGCRITPHDLRRSFLTYAKNIGIDLYERKRLVGHAIDRQDVTEGYTQHEMDDLRRAVEAISAYILRHASAT